MPFVLQHHYQSLSHIHSSGLDVGKPTISVLSSKSSSHTERIRKREDRWTGVELRHHSDHPLVKRTLSSHQSGSQAKEYRQTRANGAQPDQRRRLNIVNNIHKLLQRCHGVIPPIEIYSTRVISPSPCSPSTKPLANLMLGRLTPTPLVNEPL